MSITGMCTQSYEGYGGTVSKVHYFATGAFFFRGCPSISERCRRKRAGSVGVNRRRKINDRRRRGEVKLHKSVISLDSRLGEHQCPAGRDRRNKI